MTVAAQRSLDYTPGELTVAAFVALSVPIWTLVLINLSNLAIQGAAPEITTGDLVPMQVTPVLDMEAPLLKLGSGKKVRVKLPDMWQPPPEPRQIDQREAHVSSKAGQTKDDIPPEDLELSDAGEPPDPDAEVVAETDNPEEGSDAGDIPEGEGSPAGSPEGTETNPLKARAASLYHGRILAFLRSGFSCPAVSDEEKKACRPAASVSIGGDGTVTSFTFSPCGSSAAIDSAAQASIGSKVGQQIPPPPENYPDMRPNSFGVAYVCK
jgi:hypothetical protein